MTEPTLDDLRRQIDEIDDSIHDLIMKRAGVVVHVARAKGISTDDLPIRPAREAQMLRRLAARHKGPFPFSALSRMWHEMIAAFTLIQAEYAIAVYANEKDHSLWDIARDQFGSQAPLTAYPTPRDALTQVFEGRSGVAVLPIPNDEDSWPWWTGLCVADAPRVVARLPFAGVGSVRGQRLEAFAVAKLPLEPTGADRSLLVVETEEAFSRTGLRSLFNKAKLAPILLLSVENVGHLHLVETEGFVTENDPRLEMLAMRDSVKRVHVIGSYAKCIDTDRIGGKKS